MDGRETEQSGMTAVIGRVCHPARKRPPHCTTGADRFAADQCLSSAFFGFGGAGTFAYWNAGVAFSASFVAPGR
ncbi:hypothetical protein BPS26883_01245 [Burkholderia pseudomultivorans]|uniref:Uncharacterized protein n=1 Tax=Burkholderia pseudomultivorans TaxID=1207504 RepID=A0A6P2IHP0_9BURK|nr:hypothetical protein BPS26883_01245 [Burkholderia pseudomultivorans]